jgi:hypothetical protein
MNAIQDAICDRLVGARISRDWVNGPLHVAALVIDPDFKLASGQHDRRPSQLVTKMNWPRLFCYAFHGANAGLAEEEDRRTLAITLFREIAPRTKQKRIPLKQTCSVAAALAVRVHPLVCPGPCPLHEAVTSYLSDLADEKPPWERLLACLRALRSCPSFAGAPDDPVRISSEPVHHSVVAYRYLLVALGGSIVAIACGDAAREAARTEAKVRGVQGAADICLEAARQLGL